MAEKIRIISALSLPLSELRFRYSRSGGKGGQNVNKVETKVELLFDVHNSPSLSDVQRELIVKNLKSQLDTNGILRITSQESRSQWKNREIAKKRFVMLLHNALQIRKKRHTTKPTTCAVEKRLKEKKTRGSLKESRSKNIRDIE